MENVTAMIDLEGSRASEKEKLRAADLLRLLPRTRRTVLDVGAREGYFSKLLADHFKTVTALDLKKPEFEFPGVVTVAGDATHLDFPDDSFDCVFCAEVLEHIPDVTKACREIFRVAKYEILIGVPYRQDTRVGRLTCTTCGKATPPWGHVNRFDELKLDQLFQGCKVVERSFVGTNKAATNSVAAWLMDLAGNPWGCYEQDEVCIHCGHPLSAPLRRSLGSKICSKVAFGLNQLQAPFNRPHGNHMHTLYRKG